MTGGIHIYSPKKIQKGGGCYENAELEMSLGSFISLKAPGYT